MKTTFLNIALLLSSVTFSNVSFATGGVEQTITTKINVTNTKKLSPLEKHQLDFDLFNFCNYLENGDLKPAEGVYSSPDGRYVIALIKNNEKGHDYIGVVCAADNPYWKRGEVKFNFVLTATNKLEGYYYNSSGEYVPVSFSVEGDSLQTNRLIKMDVEKIKATAMAWL